MFPSVFLVDVENLEGSCSLYKECFELVRQKYTYVILPASQSDFSNLILEKLQKFLNIIDSEIRNARVKSLTKSEFFVRTRSRLRSVDKFARHLGDLMLLWETKKEFFWSLVPMDYTLARMKMTQLVTEKMGEFFRICEGHLIGFSAEEKGLSEALYLLIKDHRKKGTIRHSANDEDLLILADCFIYKNKRFLQGLMYLITDDGELHGTTGEIVQQPNILFNDFKPTERFIGFEPILPRKFIVDFKPQPTGGQKA
jgi:hypothetical protein